MKAKTCIGIALLAGAGLSTAAAQERAGDGGAYLSFAYGDGRIYGGNARAHRDMRGDAFEVRIGQQLDNLFGTPLADGTATRIDVVHYNEGHPDYHHRDGFALQGVAVQRLLPWLSGEAGIGPYLSMNTTANDTGREIDDSRVGTLVSAALRVDLRAWPGTHVRLTFNHVVMPGAHRSDALVLGLGRQFGPAPRSPDLAPDAPAARLWFGAAIGGSITNMSDTDGAISSAIEARQYGQRWGVGYKLLLEGDDGYRVDRRGAAVQLWYLQPVTHRLSMGAAVGPYVAQNRRDGNRTRANALITLQGEWAVSGETRAFVNFSRVKTFLDRDDRDVMQFGLLKRF